LTTNHSDNVNRKFDTLQISALLIY